MVSHPSAPVASIATAWRAIEATATNCSSTSTESRLCQSLLMHADITRLDVSGRRRSLIGYSLGMALYTLVVVALYRRVRALDIVGQARPERLGGGCAVRHHGQDLLIGGMAQRRHLRQLLPPRDAVLTVGYGAASIAGQHEEGTLSLIMALPLRRTRIVAQKMGAMVLQAVVLSVAVAICVLAGRSFDLSVTQSKAGSISPTVLLLGLDFGIITMAVGALTARRGTAIGIGAALAAVSFLASSLAPVAAWTRPARLRVAVLLVRRTEPGHRRRQSGGICHLGPRRAVRSLGSRDRVPPARRSLGTRSAWRSAANISTVELVWITSYQ